MSGFRFLALALAFLSLQAARADNVWIEFVKTLGQTNPHGSPVTTAGGRVAVDERGRIYLGTPGRGSWLMCLAAEGRPIWRQFQNVPGFQGVAIDEQYVYTCGSGHYGYRQVMRFRRDSGRAADGWNRLEWKTDEAVDGVPAMGLPVAIAVDDKYLYIADQKGDQVRRLDKATAKDAPFDEPVLVLSPSDLVVTADGRLLVLAEQALLEFDLQGKPRRTVIENLSQPVAMAYDAKTRGFFIAEGGPAKEPINQVRGYDAQGQPTGFRLGRGGTFNGPWSPDAFAFSEGSGEIELLPDGSMLVNPGWGHQLLEQLESLHRFAPDGSYQRSVLCMTPYHGMAADSRMNVYPGGMACVTLENKILWTSGLVRSGADDLYAGTSTRNWPSTAITLGERVYYLCPVDGSLMELDPVNGRVLRKVKGGKIDRSLQKAGGGGQKLWFVHAKLGKVFTLSPNLDEAPMEVVTLRREGRPDIGAASVSPDGATLFVIEGEEVSAYRISDGAVVWTKPGKGNIAAVSDMVITGSTEGGRHAMGLQVLDAGSGLLLGKLGVEPSRELPPFPAGATFAAATSDQGDFVAVAAHFGFQVLRLTRQRAGHAVTLPTLPPEQEGGENAK